MVGEISSSGSPQLRMPLRIGVLLAQECMRGGAFTPPRGSERLLLAQGLVLSLHEGVLQGGAVLRGGGAPRMADVMSFSHETFTAAPCASELTTVSSRERRHRTLLILGVVVRVRVGARRDRSLGEVERLLPIGRADRLQPVLRAAGVRSTDRKRE